MQTEDCSRLRFRLLDVRTVIQILFLEKEFSREETLFSFYLSEMPDTKQMLYVISVCASYTNQVSLWNTSG
jgi:hypothetical protein